MSNNTNFKQWDPNGANMESDAAYAADGQRTGGAGSGQIFTSPLANKLFFQNSTMMKALAEMLYQKGFTSIADGSAVPGTSIATLQAVLANLLTTADNVPQVAARTWNPSLSAGVIPTTLVNVPNDGLIHVYRISWQAKVIGSGGGSGNIIGPLSIHYTAQDTIGLDQTGLGFSRTGNLETTEAGNSPFVSLVGIPFTVLAYPNTPIITTFGYNWSGVAPRLLYSLAITAEHITTLS